MTLVAILLALSTWVACSQYSLLSSWSRTDAEVVNGEVYRDFVHNDTGSQTRPSPVFGFHCTVRFQANGRSYESQADIGYKKSAKNEMLDWYLRFPAGSHTTIAYDPAKSQPGQTGGRLPDLLRCTPGNLAIHGLAVVVRLPLALISRGLRKQPRPALDQDLQIQPGSN